MENHIMKLYRSKSDIMPDIPKHLYNLHAFYLSHPTSHTSVQHTHYIFHYHAVPFHRRTYSRAHVFNFSG